MITRALSYVLIATASLASASSAYAVPSDTITIGLQNGSANGGVLTAVATGIGFASFAGAYGTFSGNSVSAFGFSALTAPELLVSNSINIKTTAGADTLSVYITDQGVDLTGLATFISSLTSNALTNGWSVTEATYFDADNGLFATTTLLSSKTFTLIGTDVQTAFENVTSPFSVTQVYTISAAGRGSANSTIDLTAAVPEPESMPLLISGLILLGAMMGRRMRQRRRKGYCHPSMA